MVLKATMSIQGLATSNIGLSNPRHAAQTQQQKPSVSQETSPGNDDVKSDSANVSVEDPSNRRFAKRDWGSGIL